MRMNVTITEQELFDLEAEEDVEEHNYNDLTDYERQLFAGLFGSPPSEDDELDDLQQALYDALFQKDERVEEDGHPPCIDDEAEVEPAPVTPPATIAMRLNKKTRAPQGYPFKPYKHPKKRARRPYPNEFCQGHADGSLCTFGVAGKQ
eukprot:10024741-Karenia_brevis.AAC.1